MTAFRPLLAVATLLIVAGCANAPKPQAPAPEPRAETEAAPPVKEAPAATQLAAAETPKPLAPNSVDLGPLPETSAAPAPTAQAVHLGDYDALTRGGAAPSVDIGALAAAPLRTLPSDPNVRRTQPVYDAGDFAPTPVASASREFSAPPPRGEVRARAASYNPDFARRLSSAALAGVNPHTRYDAGYVRIGYPWGDVPASIGVCTDVVIRTYRALGVDLQQLVHEDMQMAFDDYPSRRIYGNTEPDPNIDHRRTVILERFFERMGASLPVSSNPNDYQPGDLVTWRISGKQPHIGVVTAARDEISGNPLIVHNIGAGVQKEDILFATMPVGHYRFTPDLTRRYAMNR